jgi:hypothetical protein
MPARQRGKYSFGGFLFADGVAATVSLKVADRFAGGLHNGAVFSQIYLAYQYRRFAVFAKEFLDKTMRGFWFCNTATVLFASLIMMIWLRAYKVFISALKPLHRFLDIALSSTFTVPPV